MTQHDERPAAGTPDQGDAADGPRTERARLDLEKLKLEVRKLQADAVAAELSWWQRPGYLGATAPVVLAMVAFSSALLSGYFDERRTILEGEIQELVEEKTQLDDAVANLQDGIDDLYLQLRVVGADIAYAQGHMQSLQAFPEAELAEIERAVADLPQEVARSLRIMMQGYDTARMIGEWTRSGLQSIEDLVDMLPATPRAREFRAAGPDADIPGRALRGPDGRLYSLENWRGDPIPEAGLPPR